MMTELPFDAIVLGLRERLRQPATPPTPGRSFQRVLIDSRLVQPGDLFVALPGERTDGHDFVADAFGRGAGGAIVARPAASLALPAPSHEPPIVFEVDDTLLALQDLARSWRAQLGVKTIGITGSVGKTTTKEMTAAVLGQRFHVLKNEGNLNNEIGLPLTLLRLEPSHDRAVLEMGFYTVGEIAQLCTIAQPSIGVLTNVGPGHAERAGTIEQIALGKGELVEALPADGLAILNGDDPRVRAMQSRTAAQVLLYGLDPSFHVWADEIESRGFEGVRFRAHYHDRSKRLQLPVLGRHSIHNLLAAAAVGLAEGLSWDEIEAGLRAAADRQRLTLRPGAAGSTIIDDTYNASPASVLAALDLLAETPGRKLAVLGDMKELGPYAREGHEQVGRRAAEVTDRLVVVGDLGRVIAEAARDAGLADVLVAETNQAAAEAIRLSLRDGDTVLVKGSRSMAMEEVVAALEEE